MKQEQYAHRANRYTRWVASALIGSAFLVTGTAWAETYTLTVKVTVVEKTCDIYGNGGLGQPISVEMGDMVIKNIDGVQYPFAIPYTLACDDAASNPALKLKFDGAGMTGQAANVLQTTTDNLGLQLTANNTPLNLGVWRNFNYNTPPALTVTPISSGTGGVNDGAFSASATLSVEYQ